MTLPTHTPAKHPFTLPAPALAAAIEAEWAAGKKYNPQTMPLTVLAYTAIDRIAEQKDEVIEALLVYIDTDTLSYRSPPSPSVGEGRDGGALSKDSDFPIAPPLPNPPPQGGREYLAQLQHERWDPILKWASSRYDAIWQVTSGVMPIEQPQALHEAIRGHLATLDAFQLSAFCVLASGFSSIALALAVTCGHVNAKDAFALSRLEEEAQAEAWGRDAEAEKRAQKMQEEILAAERFLRLLKGQ